MSIVFQSLMLFIHHTYTIIYNFAEVTVLSSLVALAVNLGNSSQAFF